MIVGEEKTGSLCFSCDGGDPGRKANKTTVAGQAP